VVENSLIEPFVKAHAFDTIPRHADFSMLPRFLKNRATHRPSRRNMRVRNSHRMTLAHSLQIAPALDSFGEIAHLAENHGRNSLAVETVWQER
jgi:hypothetical protein